MRTQDEIVADDENIALQNIVEQLDKISLARHKHGEPSRAALLDLVTKPLRQHVELLGRVLDRHRDSLPKTGPLSSGAQAKQTTTDEQVEGLVVTLNTYVGRKSHVVLNLKPVSEVYEDQRKLAMLIVEHLEGDEPLVANAGWHMGHLEGNAPR